MPADSLGPSGLKQRAAARDVAATADGVFRSDFFAPTNSGVETLRADPLITEWNALSHRAGATPFVYPDWTIAWWRAFADSDDRLALWYARHNGRVVALLPMLHRGSSLRAALNYHTPQGGLLAEDAAACEALVCALLQKTRPHEAVFPALDPLLADADICRRAARSAGHATCTLPHEEACYLTLDESWNSYEARLGRDTRGDVRRRRRRLEEQGTLSFAVEDGTQHLDALLDSVFALEASGWKRRSGTAMRSNPRVERFYRDIAAWAAIEGMLRLCFLRLGDDALAMHINLEHRGTWYLLKCGYDEHYRQASPGKVLQYHCIRHCFDTGMSRIEFCGDKDPHKLRWAPRSRVLERLYLFPESVPGQLARLRVAVRPWLKSCYARLRHAPPLQHSTRVSDETH